MESKIPLPTDNMYKFYALFGLLTFIFSVGALLYSNQSTNEILFRSFIEAEQLKQLEKPSPLDNAKMKVLERKLELAISDKKTIKYSLLVLLCMAIMGIYYGFTKWHSEIQPRQDEMTAVQLETAKLQLQKLRDDVGKSFPPTEKT